MPLKDQRESAMEKGRDRHHHQMPPRTMSAGESPGREAKSAILKQRAQALAQVPGHTHEHQASIDIIEFDLAAETYGIASAFVREIYPLKDFTPLLGVPPFVLGIINVRGEILSVIDLKKFFNLPEKGLGDLNKVIILQNDQMAFGILADAIIGAHPIPSNAIQSPPATVSDVGAEYLMGVTAKGVIILNAENLLSDEKIIVFQEG